MVADYEPLQAGLLANEDYAESETSENEKTYIASIRDDARRNKSRSLRKTVLLVVSLVLNIALAGGLLSAYNAHHAPVKSKFAGLTRDIPIMWGPNSPGNESDQDALWDMTLYDRGNIALSDTEAQELGLPRAQRWPWDKEKGIYLINAYHNLHCVAMLRKALYELKGGYELSSPWAHTQHCLMVLREEVMCNADDTPRYTGFQPGTKSGIGQVRMCKDWGRLEEWAQEKTACWKHVGSDTEPGFRELDRYRFCPDDSPYRQKSQTSWLKSDWWRKYQDPTNDVRPTRPGVKTSA